MLKLSKKADYGLIAVRHLAEQSPAGACSAKEIARAYGIPTELLAKILQKLAKNGLLVSQHGTNGGYALARHAKEISAFEVIRAIEGPLFITSCVTDKRECGQMTRCTVREPLKKVNETLVKALSAVTISSLSSDAPVLVQIEGGAVMKLPIYLDYHATTPVDPRVLEAMLPFFTENFGNPASRNHKFGWTAATAVENARKQVAKLINASAKEIVFTSGASESDNLAIKGVAHRYRDRGDHIITMATEHKAVLDSAKRLAAGGLSRNLRARAARRLGGPRRSEAIHYRQDLTGQHHGGEQRDWCAAAAGGNRPAVPRAGRAVSHRRGAGHGQDSARRGGDADRPALHRRAQDVRPQRHRRALHSPARHAGGSEPILDGGGHEGGLRSGTLNVPGIVGLGKACEICRQDDAGRIDGGLRLCATGLKTDCWRGLTAFTLTAAWSIGCRTISTLAFPESISPR